MNTKVINNLKTLLAAVEAQPEKNFDLGAFRQDEPCGTLFCTVGLACTMPVFQEMGYHLETWPNRYRPGGIDYLAKVGKEDVRDTPCADEAFGTNAYKCLFEPASCSIYDKKLGYIYEYSEQAGDYVGNMTDKELAIARLQHRITQLEGEV